jgi:hypothetical protein
LEEKMKLNMNVEELRREILEGARAVPLCRAEEVKGANVVRRDAADFDVEGERYVDFVGVGEETSVTEVATEVVYEVEGGEVSLEEVSLESGVLVYFSEV